MKHDATELLKAVRNAMGASRKSGQTRLDKSAPAEKAIHIPLPFDAVMGAVVKVKPEPKPTKRRG
jgi:hypothetical protein